MTMSSELAAEVESFLGKYIKEIRGGTAAVFVGAGLSAPAGFVDWKGLLKPLAFDLGLDIEHETDFVALAQFHLNAHAQNRHALNQLLIDEFPTNTAPTENHKLLARLPFETYWTTNYDRLIERALEDIGKIPDVKSTVAHLATTKRNRGAAVFKMHGDVEAPHEAVLAKDDYEKYHQSRGAFVTKLAGDLVSNTFLFLGFGFTDPNLDYVLSRIRTTFQANQRGHYALFKRRTRLEGESKALFEHATVRQSLVVEDLKRFNITSILLDDYSQITDILRRVESRYRRRTVFISGSAEDYGQWGREGTSEFLRRLSGALVGDGFRIVTGFGLGVGDAVITGAIEQAQGKGAARIEDVLVMRPFPWANANATERAASWEKYRQEMIRDAGICVVVLGNKRVDGAIEVAKGVRREAEIAKEHGLPVIAVGGSEFMARALWDETSFAESFPTLGSIGQTAFAELGRAGIKPLEALEPLLSLIRAIAKE